MKDGPRACDQPKPALTQLSHVVSARVSSSMRPTMLSRVSRASRSSTRSPLLRSRIACGIRSTASARRAVWAVTAAYALLFVAALAWGLIGRL